MITHISAPATQAGRQLEMTDEQERLCKVLYRKMEDGRYIFDGLWEPEDNGDDGVERIAVPLRSVIGDPEDYDMTATFANIIGSARDPKPGKKSWREVMHNNGIDCSACATDGGFYNPDDGSCFETITCKSEEKYLVGGHVTFGRYNQRTKDIKGTTVYLLPICKEHNSICEYSHPAPGEREPGTGFYMKPKAPGKVLTLLKYFQRPEEKTDTPPMP